MLNTGITGGYGQFIWANGGELFDKDFTRCTADDERVVEALQVMQDLRYKHRVAPDTAALADMKAAGINSVAQQLFFDNQVAVAIFPVVRIGEARTQAKGKWDLAVTPQGAPGKGKRVTSGGGVGWYQVKAFPYQEEAWAVLQHLTSAETHLFLADVRIPGRRSVLDKWLAQAPGEPPTVTGICHVMLTPARVAGSRRCSAKSVGLLRPDSPKEYHDSQSHEQMRHYKMVGDGAYDYWGEAEYSLETDDRGVALRQVIMYRNGAVLHYDQSYIHDEYGMLTDQPLEEEDSGQYAITREEFERAWRVPTPRLPRS